MRIEPRARPTLFVILLLSVFLNPYTLFWLHTSWTFIIAVLLVLLVWFSIKWKTLKEFTYGPHLLEIGLGSAIVISNYLRNVLVAGSFGLIDMLATLVGLSIALYGLRGLRLFMTPLVYLTVLITAYWLEFTFESIRDLEYALASFMSTFLSFINIETNLYGNVIELFTPQTSYFLRIDGPCTGIKGVLAYSALAILVLFDLRAPFRRKLLTSIIGIAGTFAVNLLRLIAIFLTIYYAGIDTGLFVHTYLGYGLFLTWVLVFWSIAFKYLTPAPVGKVPSMNATVPKVVVAQSRVEDHIRKT